MPEALDLPRPQFPSLENEVIIIKPSLEHHEDRRVNTCGNRLAQGLMHRNRQVLNKRGPFLRLRPSLGSRVNRLRHSLIHSFIHPSPIHSRLPLPLPSPPSSALWELGHFPGFLSTLNGKSGAWRPGPRLRCGLTTSVTQLPNLCLPTAFLGMLQVARGRGVGGADKRQKRRNFPESNTRREAAI